MSMDGREELADRGLVANVHGPKIIGCPFELRSLHEAMLVVPAKLPGSSTINSANIIATIFGPIKL